MQCCRSVIAAVTAALHTVNTAALAVQHLPTALRSGEVGSIPSALGCSLAHSCVSLTAGTNKYGVAEEHFDAKRVQELSIIHDTLLQVGTGRTGRTGWQPTVGRVLAAYLWTTAVRP